MPQSYLVNHLVDKDGNKGFIAPSVYFTCKTNAADPDKQCSMNDPDTQSWITLSDLSLVDGITIYVYFQQSNTANNPTLTLNGRGGSTTSRAMMLYGTTHPIGSTTDTSWEAGSIVSFTYRATSSSAYWIMNNYRASGSGGASALNDLTDVTITNPTDKQALSYDATNSNWKNTTLADVAFSGSYTDLLDKPTIPAAPIQSDWNISSSSSLAYIKNKPDLNTVSSKAYFTCTTSSTSTDKITVETSAYTLTAGATVLVKFSQPNTLREGLTLKIGNSTAKAIVANNPRKFIWKAEDIVPFTYDGTNWICNADVNTIFNIPVERKFILTPVGTEFGSKITDTGSYYHLKEKRGNTVVVNQLVQNPNFVNTNNWSASNGVLTVANNIGTFTGNNDTTNKNYAATGVVANKPIGHKYLGFFEYISNYDFNTQMASTGFIVSAANSFTSKAFIQEKTSAEYGSWYFYNYNGVTDWVLQLKNVFAIDLTQWFGSNNKIPTHLLNHPEDFFRYYQGSLAYNVGTLTDCNGRYLKTTGRNVWDEEWELGRYGASTGAKAETGYDIRNKTPIPAIPNTVYHFHCPASGNVFFYDAEGNYIGNTGSMHNNATFTTPANCWLICFCTYAGSGYTTYNHDITISLYYEGESGYDQYYPYEELANIDTGNEVLKDAGDDTDYKLSDGTIYRLVKEKSVTAFDGAWGAVTNGYGVYLILSDLKQGILRQRMKANRFVFSTSGRDTAELFNFGGSDGAPETITFILPNTITSLAEANAWLTNNPTTIIYPVSEPTTEQGTPFAENVAIDDFGTMAFDCPNGVPQGLAGEYTYQCIGDTLPTMSQYCLNIDSLTKIPGKYPDGRVYQAETDIISWYKYTWTADLSSLSAFNLNDDIDIQLISIGANAAARESSLPTAPVDLFFCVDDSVIIVSAAVMNGTFLNSTKTRWASVTRIGNQLSITVICKADDRVSDWDNAQMQMKLWLTTHSN